jgi:hypothetical protein
LISAKQPLHRSQDSPDILPEQLTATPVNYNSEQLQELVQGHNPAIHMDANTVQSRMPSSNPRSAMVTLILRVLIEVSARQGHTLSKV